MIDNIKVKITLDDFQKFNWHHLKKLKIALLILFAYLVMLFYMKAFFLQVLVSVVWIIALWLSWFRLKKRVRVSYENNSFLKEELSFAFYDNYIELKSSKTLVRLDSENIRNIEERKDYYFINVCNNTGQILPKRCFENMEQEKEFVAYLRKLLPEEKIEIIEK